MLKKIRSGNKQRLRVELDGAVQGVGFRPFIYRLATELRLVGWVVNDARGVLVEVEGQTSALGQFLERLYVERPPRSLIHRLSTVWLGPVGYRGFEIRESGQDGQKTVIVLPDIATCPDCLAEIFDPTDRRHRYPFTNCTSCGPRFTIVDAVPYDRPNTTMRKFAMCPHCLAEYVEPRDRRFHAQPNACPDCGPHLFLWTPAGALLANDDTALRLAAQALGEGRIVAVKGLGGFHLMVDARNRLAVMRLRESKPRCDKPFALMVGGLDQARELCEVEDEAAGLLSGPEAPIVLLRRLPGSRIAPEVAPGNPNLGVMLPYTPLHHLLTSQSHFPLVATSGNLSDEPICTDEAEAVQRLGGVADLFLVHDRPISRHVDDSVVWRVLGEARLLRRARGYAPLPILVPDRMPPILAVGAHLKSTVALAVERQVFISQHIGDLDTPEARDAFQRVIAAFLRLYEVAPVAVACDLHPDYASSHWAQEAAEKPSTLGLSAEMLRLIRVQHHHAHLASCLADNGVTARALGVTWDGTGLGVDGTIWGGEFILGDASGFQRVAHLRSFSLPGGDAAIKEPWRVALALLLATYGDEVLEWHDLAPLNAASPSDVGVVAQMLAKGVNIQRTTSAGRLFDGVAALAGLRQMVTFEGQAAMALEFAVDAGVSDRYPLPLDEAGSSFELDWRPLIEGVVGDLRRRVAVPIVAARFHNALIAAIVEVARNIGEERLALTGGCFQNRLLVERSAQRLSESGHTVLLHRQVPPNDGGISLGQAVIAAALSRQGYHTELAGAASPPV